MLERQRTKNSPKPKTKVAPGILVKTFYIPFDTLAQNQANLKLYHELNTNNIYIEIVDSIGRSCMDVCTAVQVLDSNTIEIDTRNVTTGFMVRITA